MKSLRYFPLFFFLLSSCKKEVSFTFSQDGVKEFQLTPKETLRSKFSPRVASTKEMAVVVFEDRREGIFKIYSQLLDKDGNLISSNFRVSEEVGKEEIVPEVDMAKDGKFAVVFERKKGADWDIFLRIFDSKGTPKTEEIKVDGSPWVEGNPDVAWLGEDKILVVYQKGRGKYWNIFGKIFRGKGEEVGESFQVNEDGKNHNLSPKVLPTREGFIVTWVRYEKERSRIYFRYFDLEGIPISKEFPLLEEEGSQFSPYPFHIGEGEGIVAVIGKSKKKVVVRKISKDGPLGPAWVLFEGRSPYLPEITEIDSNIILLLSSKKLGSFDVFLRIYNREMKPITPFFLVNDYGKKGSQWQADLDIMGDRVVIVWSDGRGVSSEIFCEVLNPRKLLRKIEGNPTPLP